MNMNKLHHFILQTHRLLGQIISVYVLLWFASAFVMLFKPYPSYSPEEARAHAQPLPQNMQLEGHELERIQQAADSLSLGQEPYQICLSYSSLYGAHYRIEGQGGDLIRVGRDAQPLTAQSPTESECQRIASLWQSQIARIDTVHSLDQWTPFDRLRKDLPFLRIHLQDEGRQVYLSSYDGRILTEHTQSERAWAWVGSIPHWVYFTQLRQNAPLWRTVVAVLALVGTLMAVAGLWIGAQRYWLTRKSRKGVHSPYRRGTDRWHHIVGTLFGIFILSWLFSGMMSVVEIPEWMGGKAEPSGRLALEGRSLRVENYPTDGLNAHLGQSSEQVTGICLTSLGAKLPLVRIDYAGQEVGKVYRSGTALEPLSLRAEEVAQAVRTAYSLSAEPEVEYLQGSDGYYLDRDPTPSAPLYRLSLPTVQRHYVYIEPETAQVKVLEWRERLRMLMYTKPHGLRFSWLEYHSPAWWALMFVLLSLGLAVSVTGIWMFVRRLRRR